MIMEVTMNPVLDILKTRGLFAQCSNAEGLTELMTNGSIVFYIGVDPTSSSLHIGHMVPFFAFRHLMDAGQKGIALKGVGTARIGDPSGRTETRKLLSYEELDNNAESIGIQLANFIKFDGDKARFANNKDWLASLNYIDFLREIGVHFSVNRMLSLEAYKARMETGLSFIEFNYQLLQSYDFLELYRRFDCRLQIGGDDQWGNILAGVDLIRRVEGAEAFALTFPLVSTADGKKMGKTLKGALFLDPAITPPYEFFQYWRNVHDMDARRFLLMFTFLPVEEIDKLTAAGNNPNDAKERLAWEITSLIHGKEEADKAMSGARAAFGGDGDMAGMPQAELSAAKFKDGYNVVDLFCDAALVPSKSEGRRLVEQGGAFILRSGKEPEAVGSVAAVIKQDSLDDKGELIIRAGKKRYCLVRAK